MTSKLYRGELLAKINSIIGLVVHSLANKTKPQEESRMSLIGFSTEDNAPVGVILRKLSKVSVKAGSLDNHAV